MGCDVKHYTVELRIREAGDVGDALPIKALVELPADAGRIWVLRHHVETLGGAMDWAMANAVDWMRNRESKG